MALPQQPQHPVSNRGWVWPVCSVRKTACKLEPRGYAEAKKHSGKGSVNRFISYRILNLDSKFGHECVRQHPLCLFFHFMLRVKEQAKPSRLLRQQMTVRGFAAATLTPAKCISPSPHRGRSDCIILRGQRHRLAHFSPEARERVAS